MWAEFYRLQSIWRARPEGRGGVAALLGFQFQLAAVLLEIVRTGSTPNRADVFLEALSDIVTADGGYLIVTQAKLSLDSAALKKALTELWEVHTLASAQAENIAPLLRYRILTSAQILKDVASALARWRPDHAVDESDLEAFRFRVSVRVEPDPLQSLAVYLVNAFSDPSPFETVNNWLGRLFSDPTAGFEHSCRFIATQLDALAAAARERTRRFYVWDTNDQAPSEPRLEIDLTKATLTGQLPNLSHLREGRFAPRECYVTMHCRVEAWLSDQKDRNDRRLPVWWIAGPSGTGKSVALLHLLASLHREDDRRIIVWLGDQADRLAEAIRWARPFFARGQDIIFASDDPYTVERGQRVAVSIEDALRELDSIALAYTEARQPSLICCGPTEQSENFEDELVDRVLIDRPPSALIESLDDIDQLREWYRHRTGRANLPVGDSKDVLIVQLFFEWATGKSLREFALRFRERLEAMGRSKSSSRTIFDLMAEILALNRLYALFPAPSINNELERDPQLGAAFDRLKQLERHLTFDSESGGYRLTHPHLANAIYTAWFGRSEQRRQRKAHLRAGIDAALNFESAPSRRFAPLWAIARLTSGRAHNSMEAQKRIALIEPELRELLVEVYERQFARSQNPLTDLPVWADLDRQLNLILLPPPIMKIGSAVSSAAESAPGLRLSCHKLLQHKDSLQEATSVVALVLQTYPTWRELGAVAADYVSLVGLIHIEEPVRGLVAREWTRPAVRRLVAACFRQSDREVARRVVLAWLQAAPMTDLAWPRFFTEFVDTFYFCGTSHTLAWKFIHEEWNHPSWSHVWERLQVSPRTIQADWISIARRWLYRTRAEISGWDRVWENLWKRSDKSDDILRTRARKWLDEVPADHGSWTFVWLAIWKERPDDDLRTRARKWLGEIPADQGSWAFVWEAIWKDKPDDDLRIRARKWLDEVPADHGSWRYVWEALWQDKPDDDLRTRARKWLDEIPADHGSWAFAWEVIWKDKPDDDLRIRARKWLDEVPADHGSWRYVWEALWQDKPEDGLRSRARKWLDEVPADHGSWAFVWLALWKVKPDDDLRACARKWLYLVPAAIERKKYVWHALWRESDKTDVELRTIGNAWLQEMPEAPSAKRHPYEWKDAWEIQWNNAIGLPAKQSHLAIKAMKWLGTYDLEQYGWTSVWRVLLEYAATNDTISQREFLDLGLGWLERIAPTHPRWALMWLSLWDTAQGTLAFRDLLIRKGRDWLVATGTRTDWHLVWKELWKIPALRDNELEAAARFRSKKMSLHDRLAIERLLRQSELKYLL